MRSEWKSVDDSMGFWLADHADDTSTKLALVQKIAEISAALCTKCNPPKECHCHLDSLLIYPDPAFFHKADSDSSIF